MIYRPLFHFSASKGWINDPNGLVFYKGYYHLFFQHNPDSIVWDKMHWGHAISTDMIHWQELPIALYPEEDYENDENGGCFSGSAVVVDDRLYLVYTATCGGVQSQCLAYSDDGFKFEKYSGNPVIIPASGVHDSRDPYVFSLDGRYNLLLGFDGHIERYSSTDLKFWKNEGTFFSFGRETGTIAECPSIFKTGDYYYLSFSPISCGTEGCNSLFVEGTIENGRFVEHRRFPADCGPDFYALQTFPDENGNRIGMAWANGWPWMRDFEGFGPTGAEGWRGALTFPRIYSVKNNHLYSYPVPAAEASYKEKVIDKEMVISREYSQIAEASDVFHLSISLDPGCGDMPSLETGIYEDGQTNLRLLVDFRKLEAVLLKAKENGDIIRFFSAHIPQGKISIDIFADRASTEIYFNKGFSSFSINAYRIDGFTGPWLRTLSGEMEVDVKLFI